MSSEIRKKLFLVLLTLLIAILVTGCSGTAQEKLWLKTDSWSRGLLLGETNLAAPVEVKINESGDVYGVLFPRDLENDNLYQPELITMHASGKISERKPLDFLISQPRQSKIFLTDQGIDLFWIDSHQVKMIQFDLMGNLLSDVRILSGSGIASNFEVLYVDDSYFIFYSGRQDNPGVYALSGALDDLQETTIDPLGIRVNLFQDSESQFHLLWARYPVSYGDLEFYYAKYSPDLAVFSDPTIVFTKYISPTSRIEGPVLSVDTEVVYLFWSEVVLTGLEAGNSTTNYRYFPIGQPDAVRPTMSINIPSISGLEQSSYPYGFFDVGDRVSLGGYFPRTPYIEDIKSLDVQFEETALVFRSRSEYKWRDRRNQVNVAYLSDGLITSYQPLSYTSAESYYPSVILDQDMNLYVTWLEKGELTYRVYLTTTDSLKKTNIDLVTVDDYLYLAAEGLFGILAGAVLSPFAAVAWGGIGLIGFIFNMIFSQFNRPVFRTIGEILSMATGVGVFWFMKLATLPGLKTLDYVPFSAWIPRIPDNLTQLLIYGVPALIALIAFSVAYFKTYGKKSGSPIYFYLLYCAVDALLSCAVYGILIYGSF